MEETCPEASLLGLVETISKFCLDHSAEAEVCDMLMEIEKIDMIVELVSKDVHERVCLYLIRWVWLVVCFHSCVGFFFLFLGVICNDNGCGFMCC